MKRIPIILLFASSLLAVDAYGQRGEERQHGLSGENVHSPQIQSRLISPSQKPQRDNADARREQEKIFGAIREGFSSGSIGNFSNYFGSQVQVNLRGGESGAWSPNQTYYVLENYLKTRRVVSLEFSSIGESQSNPFATGSIVLAVRGVRESLQIYVSLSLTGENWVITQINIY